MGNGIKLAEHGGCTLENKEVMDYQCICNYDGVSEYQYIFLSFSILSLFATAYLLIETYRIVKKNKLLFPHLKLKFLSLSVALVWSILSTVYFGVDPHQCKRRFSNVMESILYGLGICLPAILLMIVIFRWLDLLKASFSKQNHALFKPVIKKYFFSLLIFWFLFEIICRIFWVGSTYYIYSIWGCLYTFVCFVGYLVLGTKLNRKLLYGAKLAGSIDPTRRKQINQIYKVGIAGCLICITSFFGMLIAMAVNCFVQAKCSFYMENAWKIEQLLIVWLYIWLAWVGNRHIKNPKKPNKNKTEKYKPDVELVEKRSDLEDERNTSQPNSYSNSNSKSRTDSSFSDN
ncbi:hypothetical protein M0812_16113 [Anaeramoeba flamelloides]|uniref:Uncharacterized protein n=1 Tax=Anaeramoeba flamelloides TaxID=1746091 RepID=A0AAV7ZJB9_9EUKA|nr:hypothetical protein M0812_16113 [Anaeramoeba flamelloides]